MIRNPFANLSTIKSPATDERIITTVIIYLVTPARLIESPRKRSVGKTIYPGKTLGGCWQSKICTSVTISHAALQKPIRCLLVQCYSVHIVHHKPFNGCRTVVENNDWTVKSLKITCRAWTDDFNNFTFRTKYWQSTIKLRSKTKLLLTIFIRVQRYTRYSEYFCAEFVWTV